MAGFPGESDAEFHETLKLVEDLPLTYLHVFTYSARPGTPAAILAQKVPAQVARERNRLLRDLASRKRQAFMQSFVGKAVEAITLSSAGKDQEGEYTTGLTDNYLPIRLTGSHPPNQWIRVEVERLSDETLVGRVN
jgi:threonylcarbamoyladenosine tRNA methylthiotransferase MtaB